MNVRDGVFLLLFFIVNSTCAQTFKSEGDFKKYFTEHSAALDTIEGLWDVKTSQEFSSYDTLYDEKTFNQTVAIVKKDTNFVSYDMRGDAYNVYFNKTSVDKVFLYRIWLKEITQYTKADAVISSGRVMQYKYEFPEEYLHQMFKNSYEPGERVVNKVVWKKIYPK